MAGSLPRLPQRLMVSGETRKSSATSRTVKRSGRFSSDSCFFGVAVSLTAIVLRTISERFASCQPRKIFSSEADVNLVYENDIVKVWKIPQR